MSQTVHFGFGSLARLELVLRSLSPRRILLVTGRNSFCTSGAERAVCPILQPYEVSRFSEFAENPKLEEARKGVELFRSFNPDVVLAVGGGTVLDMAKLITGLGMQTNDIAACVTGEALLRHPARPLLAIPTTAGSGSEATHFAVVYCNKTKYSLAHASLRPAVAILDPELTLSLPPELTATTGFDALSQAVESLWSVHSTDATRAWAREAIALILKHLPEAVHRPTGESRQAMLRAAHLAGCAINITKTTAPHAVSYAMTAHFGVRHGQAVALTLPHFFAFNAKVREDDVADSRGTTFVRAAVAELAELFGCQTPDEAADKIRWLMREVGLATTLAEAGIVSNGARQILLDHVNPERMSNNPRRITRPQLAELLERA